MADSERIFSLRTDKKYRAGSIGHGIVFYLLKLQINS